METRVTLSRIASLAAVRLRTGVAAALTISVVLVASALSAPGGTARAHQAVAASTADSSATALAVSMSSATARIWMDYNTYVPESRLSEDIDYDFSAQMLNELETAAQKTIEKWGKKVENVGKYLAILSSTLTAFALKHPLIATVAAIVAIVSSVLAVAALPLSRWFYIVKEWWKKAHRKGSHQKYGFWVKSFEDVVGQSYVANYARSCAAKTIKCGSPGYWKLHGAAQPSLI